MISEQALLLLIRPSPQQFGMFYLFAREGRFKSDEMCFYYVRHCLQNTP